MRALGAEPIEVFGSRSGTRALEHDEIAGFEVNLLGYRLLNLWRQAPYVTANVNLWPQVTCDHRKSPTASHPSATSRVIR